MIETVSTLELHERFIASVTERTPPVGRRRRLQDAPLLHAGALLCFHDWRSEDGGHPQLSETLPQARVSGGQGGGCTFVVSIVNQEPIRVSACRLCGINPAVPLSQHTHVCA